MNNQPNNNQLVIYQSPDGSTSIDVTVEGETVWLGQKAMADLFGVKVPAISKHIKNIFASGELDLDTTVSKMETVVNRGIRGLVTEAIEIYNLDMILSVGYRVNSKRAIAFRQWSTKVLKQYLLNGYAVNERIRAEEFDELSQLVKVMGRAIQHQELITEDSRSLFNVVVDYTYALDTLDRYDYQELSIENTTGNEPFHATYENAMEVIRGLHEKFGGSDLFGNEKDDSFKSSIGQIYQTFGGVDLTLPLKRRQQCCSISSPRITRSATATNALPPRYSSGFSTTTAYSTTKTAPSASPTTPSWRSPS